MLYYLYRSLQCITLVNGDQIYGLNRTKTKKDIDILVGLQYAIGEVKTNSFLTLIIKK